MSEKTLIDRIVLADEQGHLQGKPLESVRSAVADAVPPAVAAEVAKLPKPAAEITPAALAKEMGVWFVYGGAEPEPTKYGVNVVWVDTINPSAHVPAAPVFSQQAKTIEIPADRGVTYRIDGAPVEAGTSRVTEPFPKTVRVSAIARSGFTLAVGAQAEWSFTFESVAIPYEDAVLPMTSYWRLDDPAGTKKPKVTGASPLVQYAELNDSARFGAPGIGVGLTSVEITRGGIMWAEFAPASVRSFTWTTAMKWVAGAGIGIELGASQKGAMPGMKFFAQADGRTVAPLAFTGMGVTNVVAVKPTPQPANGDIIHLGYTWDGSSLRGYINGELIATAAWSGSTVGSELIKPMSYSVAAGKAWSVAGLGFSMEAKPESWMKAASAALKKAAR